MTIKIKAVTKENIRGCVSLEVSEDQKGICSSKHRNNRLGLCG
ncbi:hypothetical protein [Paucisalibacillus sp. EB02]|nr:hypothetical protein [Paucisalibacillus sp. EB02]